MGRGDDPGRAGDGPLIRWAARDRSAHRSALRGTNGGTPGAWTVGVAYGIIGAGSGAACPSPSPKWAVPRWVQPTT
jgi:hypothetical protein